MKAETTAAGRWLLAAVVVTQLAAVIGWASAPTLDSGFVAVPAGPFIRGDHDGQFDEKPVQIVDVSAFSIQRTEVTQADYLACVQAQRCEAPKILSPGPNYPAVGVTWKDARAFCRWKGWRLPTEAEWEKAARGTDGRRYPWGNRDKRGGQGRANCAEGCGNAHKTGPVKGQRRGKLAPVGQFKAGASTWGALDMAGNVEEWVADWYGEGYYGTAPKKDPTGPISGQFRAVRDGEYSQELDVLRTSNRYWAKPSTYNGRRGFRCAR